MIVFCRQGQSVSYREEFGYGEEFRFGGEGERKPDETKWLFLGNRRKQGNRLENRLNLKL